MKLTLVDELKVRTEKNGRTREFVYAYAEGVLDEIREDIAELEANGHEFISCHRVTTVREVKSVELY